jgi:hypothetical protein
MTTQPVNSLPTATSAATNDILVIVQSGVYKKIGVNNIKTGITNATNSTPGLMSATDKDNLDTYGSQIAAVVAPSTFSLAAASTLTITDPSKYVITLTGTTAITSVVGLTPRVKYAFSYPSGAGLTFLGEPMQAGDVFEVIDV